MGDVVQIKQYQDVRSERLEYGGAPGSWSTDIIASNVDDLVAQGLDNAMRYGVEVAPRAGRAVQCYGVNYVLTDSRSRVHSIRKGAVRYLARELLAYFRGSLKAEDGLARASKFWTTLTDENGNINSNYGYYVFHEEVDHPSYRTQYDWVIHRLSGNRDSRRALININQNYHKSETKDFPCTVALNFFIRDDHVCCEVFSRSTDIITGLPYDVAFFSFLTELIHADLVERGYTSLRLGHTMMRTIFTQIYDRTRDKAEQILAYRGGYNLVAMPPIERASAVLEDIYNGTSDTPVMQWLVDHAELG